MSEMSETLGDALADLGLALEAYDLLVAPPITTEEQLANRWNGDRLCTPDVQSPEHK